jgi:hypothetical protein
VSDLPLIVRLGVRVATFVVLFLLIGLVDAVATHWLGERHLDLLSRDTITAYRGGLNMLLILWFFGLLAKPAPDHPQ